MEDTSYSGIVNTIQGDRDRGQEMIRNLILKLNREKIKVEAIQKDLTFHQNIIRESEQGIKNVLQHLEIPQPLIVSIEGSLYGIDRDKVVKMDENFLGL